MAEKKKPENAPKKQHPLLAAARRARDEGDFALVRRHATALRAAPDAADGEKEEAAGMLEAIRIDRAPVLAGAAAAVVLVVLFALVVTGHF